jgi:hypothetical protein
VVVFKPPNFGDVHVAARTDTRSGPTPMRNCRASPCVRPFFLCGARHPERPDTRSGPTKMRALLDPGSSVSIRG